MLIDGKKIALSIYNELKNNLLKQEIKPTLAVVLVGNNSSSLRYIRQKEKWAKYIGINFKLFQFDISISEKELLENLSKLNNDKSITGYIVQLPLPKHIDEKKIINFIDYKKDVDGFHPINQGKLLIDDKTGLIPCTPAGIMEILYNQKVNLIGKNIAVVGRSNIVGKPVTNLLINAGATVTSCNSKTRNLKKIIKNVDIVIVAIGKANFIDSSFLKEDSIVIDVGFSVINGKIYGDCNTDEINKFGAKITPVPGGVGPLTVAMLMKNLLKAYNLFYK